MPQQPVLYRGKSVTTIHDLTLLNTYMSDKNWIVYKTKQLVGRFVFHRVIKKNSFIITDTNYTKRKLGLFDSKAIEKTIAIPLSADKIKVKPTPCKLPFKQYIMYVGQQANFKNIRRLIDAHGILRNKYPDLGLVLVGREDEMVRRHKKYVAKKSYENVLFTGFVSDEELAWLYTNTSEVYGHAAHYFDPRDPSDMATAIEEVLSRSKLRELLVSKGKTQLKKYSWKTTARKTHAVYLKALED
jgi:glycosyltransferase involved in cell wall biosynthesis